MSLVTSVGALTFELERSAAMSFPQIDELPLFIIDGLPVHRLSEDGSVYLVVDHRLEGSLDRPARVEFWKASGAYEGPLAGLLLIADGAASPNTGEFPSGLPAFLHGN